MLTAEKPGRGSGRDEEKAQRKPPAYIAIENCIVESLIPTLLRRPAMPASSQSKQHLSIGAQMAAFGLYFFLPLLPPRRPFLKS